MHPCCGKDLRWATKIAAIIDIVWTSVFIAVAIVIIITTAMEGLIVQQESQTTLNSSKPIGAGGESDDVMKLALGGIIVGTIILVVKILQLILAFLLYQGARERDHYKCKIWIYITSVFVIITVMNFVFDVVSVEGSKAGSIISVIGILLHVYFLWIVWSYKQVLEAGLAKPEADACANKP